MYRAPHEGYHRTSLEPLSETPHQNPPVLAGVVSLSVTISIKFLGPDFGFASNHIDQMYLGRNILGRTIYYNSIFDASSNIYIQEYIIKHDSEL